jgi:hypothetical protein
MIIRDRQAGVLCREGSASDIGQGAAVTGNFAAMIRCFYRIPADCYSVATRFNSPDVLKRSTEAPDLGLRNHRFQRVAFRFKANAFYELKTGFSYKTVAAANGE